MKKQNVKIESSESPFPYSLYLPEGSGPFPLIIQTPVLGRVIFLEDLHFEKKAAAAFARQGFACALIHRPIFDFDPSQGLEQIGAYVEESLARNQKVFEKLMGDPRLDAERTGTFGMSCGAIISCLWASRNRRLREHVWVMGGANLPEIFISSEDPLMKSYRDAALEKSGLDPSALEVELRKIFTHDPLHLAFSIPPENILLILAVFDRVVRFANGLKLKEILKNPPTVFLPLGHYTTMLALPLVQRLAAVFFKKKFLAPCTA